MSPLASFCRLRPDLRNSSKVRCDPNAISVRTGDTASPQTLRKQRSSKTLPSTRQQQGPSFSAVWGNSSGTGSQEDVFLAVEPYLRKAVDEERSCTVFVYGGPSSGKTYTLAGDISNPKEQGIVPRAINFALNYQPQRDSVDGYASITIPTGEAPAAHAYFFELFGEHVCDLFPEGDAACGTGGSPSGVGRSLAGGRKCRWRQTSAAAGHVVVDGIVPWTSQASVVQLLSFYLRGLDCKKQACAASCFQITLLSSSGTARATLRFVELGAPRASQQQQSAASPPPAARSSKLRTSVGGRPSKRDASASRGRAPANETMLAALEKVVAAKIAGEPFETSCRGCALTELLRPCLEGHQDLCLLLCARPDDLHVGTLAACLRLPQLLQELPAESQAPVDYDNAYARGHERGTRSTAMDLLRAPHATPAKVSSATIKPVEAILAVPIDDNDVPSKTMSKEEAGSMFSAAEASTCGRGVRPIDSCQASAIDLEESKGEDQHLLLPCIKEKHNSIYQLVLECERIKAAITSLEKDLITTQLSRQHHPRISQEQSLQAIIRKLEQDLAKQQVALEEKGQEYSELMSLCVGLVPSDANLAKQLEDVQRTVADALTCSMASAPTRTPSESGTHFRQTITEPQQSPTSSATRGRTGPPSETATPQEKRSPETATRNIEPKAAPMIWPPISVAKRSQARTVPRLRIIDALPKTQTSTTQDALTHSCGPTAANDNSSDSASLADSPRKCTLWCTSGSPSFSVDQVMSGSASVPAFHRKAEVSLSPTPVRGSPWDSPPMSSTPMATRGPARKSAVPVQQHQRALVRSSSRRPPFTWQSSGSLIAPVRQGGSLIAPVRQDLSASLQMWQDPSRVLPWSAVVSETLPPAHYSRFQLGGSFTALSTNSVPTPFLPLSAHRVC